MFLLRCWSQYLCLPAILCWAFFQPKMTHEGAETEPKQEDRGQQNQNNQLKDAKILSRAERKGGVVWWKPSLWLHRYQRTYKYVISCWYTNNDKCFARIKLITFKSIQKTLFVPPKDSHHSVFVHCFCVNIHSLRRIKSPNDVFFLGQDRCHMPPTAWFFKKSSQCGSSSPESVSDQEAERASQHVCAGTWRRKREIMERKWSVGATGGQHCQNFVWRGSDGWREKKGRVITASTQGGREFSSFPSFIFHCPSPSLWIVKVRAWGSGYVSLC